jgi:hypothetical protein
VESAIPLLEALQNRSLAQSVLNQWALLDDSPKLVQAANRANPRVPDYIDAIVIQLIQLKDEASVLPFLNHPSNSVRASVTVAMNDWNLSEERIVQQSIEDLEQEGRQEAALSRLQSMALSEAQQEETAQAAKQLLLEGAAGSVGTNAIELLEQYGGIDTALLIKVYESQNNVFVRETELRERASEALTMRPEASVFLLFASQLDNRDRQAAERGATSLKNMGPAAESYVWPALRNDDRTVRERACNLLAAIGTTNSVPHLERLGDDEATSSQAQAAILDIQNADRQPIENSPTTPLE